MPENVIKNQSSLGFGIAYLFYEISNQLGIVCKVIHGTLKLPPPHPNSFFSGPISPMYPNHAWNSVTIDNEHYFIDICCASPKHPLNTTKDVDDGFFLAKTTEFIFTHIPLKAENQYNSPVLSYPVFWQLPYVRPAFFRDGLRFLNLNSSNLVVKNDEIIPLILHLKDETINIYAELEIFPKDFNIVSKCKKTWPAPVQRHPLLSQCINYNGKRMVKIYIGVNSKDCYAVLNIYSGKRPTLLSRKLKKELLKKMISKDNLEQGTIESDLTSEIVNIKSAIINNSENVIPVSVTSKQSRVIDILINPKNDVNETNKITKTNQVLFNNAELIGTPNSETYSLAANIPVHHLGKPFSQRFIQTNHFSEFEFYFKSPITSDFPLNSIVNFHILPTCPEFTQHYKIQLLSPSEGYSKFLYQSFDQSYVLSVKFNEVGNWRVICFSKTEGWSNITVLSCY
ncbi:cytokinesis protein 3 [Smittium culicis]|uniref:Cytokinesis protein 3 n=1 Tax=Smittium culicis TaxID=133412 RepID=A0A1R1YBG4_9FUNG|nr:cytokinesis protein 3 [Smittium culicis]